MNFTKKVLFGLIMLVMLISPVAKEINTIYNIEIAPLKGYIQLSEKPEFSIDSWMNGSFQLNYDKYLEDHIGFRNLLVRLYNQIDFSLFRVGHAAGVIIGKEDYLYELNYILAYTGKDYLGDDFIRDKCEKIKIVQDRLSKLNTELLIVLAPGKASFFPEYIPDKYLEEPGTITNNEAYLSSFQDMGINHIDFNTLFANMRDTVSYELYHKCGIHWSRYGSLFALDSVIHYIEEKKNTDIVDMGIEGINVSYSLDNSDYDVAAGLNLLFEIPGKPMPYPYGYTYDAEGKEKLKLMVVADSYYWSMYTHQGAWEIWDELDFRYYNKITYRPNAEESDPIPLRIDELAKFDVIMILYTEANMTKMANDFFEEAYVNLNYQDELETIKHSIRNSPEWLKEVEEKAIRENVSLDEMIILVAEWVLNNKLKNNENESENN